MYSVLGLFPDNGTPLTGASRNGNIVAAKILLEYGANVNYQSPTSGKNSFFFYSKQK